MSNPPIVPRSVVTQLGCEPVEVQVQPRGGGRGIPIASGVGSTRNWSSVEWHRLLGDQSGCQLRVEGRAACCDWASKVIPWQHELVVFQGGTRAWSGPVVEVTWVGDELRIECKDRMEWMRRRKIHSDHEYGAGVDLAIVFVDLIDDAMSVDTSPNVSTSALLTGTTIGTTEGRKYIAAQRRYVNDALNELARTGLEWTCVDFTCYISGPNTPNKNDPVLRSIHFEDEPEGVSDGGLFGTRFEVVGAGGGEAGDTLVGTHTTDASLEADYGVHEVIVDEEDIRDQTSANAAALARYRQYGRNGVPYFVLGAKLNPSAPITIDDLIPGRLFRIEHEDPCKPVPSRVRLDRVTGSVGPEHQYVKLDLSPVVDES